MTLSGPLKYSQKLIYHAIRAGLLAGQASLSSESQDMAHGFPRMRFGKGAFLVEAETREAIYMSQAR